MTTPPPAGGLSTPFRPKAIIFDLLTALLDSWTLWDSAAAAAAASSSSSPNPGLAWRKAYLGLTYGCGRYKAYESLVQESARLAQLPPSAPAYLLEHWDELQAWPETVCTLDGLRSHGYQLAVVTNCSARLGERAAGFFPFDALVTAEESGFYKPHAKPYEDVLGKLGVKAEDALFVAGSASDVPGANGAGMQVVWHNRVGLEAKEGSVRPWKEGARLDEVSGEWL